MRHMLVALAVVSLLGVLQVDLWAGGGGKADCTIEIKNNSRYIAAVGVDMPASLLPPNPVPTQAQWTAAGGKILQPGERATFKVKAGPHIVVAGLFDANGNPVNSLSKTYTLVKGQWLTVTVTDTALLP